MIVNGNKELANVSLIENGVFNHEASNYLAEHYNEILKRVPAYGIKSKAEDLLQDVYISLLNSENKGEAYDMNYRTGSIITLEQFVYKRLKMYAKNDKYHDDKVETWKAYTKTFEDVEEVTYDIDGTVREKGKTKKVAVNKQVCCSVYAATPDNTSDLDELSSMQTAYAMAVDLDAESQIEAVEEMLSIKGEIDTCVDICEMHGYDIINTFKNIDKLASLIGTGFKKAGEVFAELRELVSNNDELAESVMNVLKFSMENRELFNRAISTY